MEISTMLTPCSVKGCVQGDNNLVNTTELQHFLPCYKIVTPCTVYKICTQLVLVCCITMVST